MEGGGNADAGVGAGAGERGGCCEGWAVAVWAREAKVVTAAMVVQRMTALVCGAMVLRVAQTRVSFFMFVV